MRIAIPIIISNMFVESWQGLKLDAESKVNGEEVKIGDFVAKPHSLLIVGVLPENPYADNTICRIDLVYTPNTWDVKVVTLDGIKTVGLCQVFDFHYFDNFVDGARLDIRADLMYESN